MGLTSSILNLHDFIFVRFSSVVNPFYFFRYRFFLRSESDGLEECNSQTAINPRRKIQPAEEDKQIPLSLCELEFVERCRLIETEEIERYGRFKVKRRSRKRRKLQISQEVVLRGLRAKHLDSLDNSFLVDVLQTKITTSYVRTITKQNWHD